MAQCQLFSHVFSILLAMAYFSLIVVVSSGAQFRPPMADV
jgi:hypothetical protein